MQKTYPALDIAKLVMAFAVVGIHRRFFQQEVLDYLTGTVLFTVAVPFFFAISSFLFFRKFRQPEQNERTLFLHFEKRLILLYILYTILYMPCLFVKYHTGHYSEITLSMLAGDLLVIVKDALLDFSFTHLWYLNTLILSVCILYLVTRAVRNKWGILAVGAASFVLITAAQALYPRIETQIHALLFNTLQTGLPCTCAGYFAAQKEDRTTRTEKIACPVMIVLLLLCGTVTLLNDAVVFAALQRVFAYAFAYLVLRVCVGSSLKPNPAYPVMRKYSTLIYFWHLMLMEEGLRFLAVHTGLTGLSENGLLRYSLGLFTGIAAATVIILLQKHRHFRWLRYLY